MKIQSSSAPSPYYSDHQTPALIGIDVGGTKIQGGIVSQEGEVLFHHNVPTRRLHLLNDIISVAKVVTSAAEKMGIVTAGIGVGTTGFIDRSKGLLVKSINMQVAEIPIGQELALVTGRPIFVDNDVHAATLGEVYFGAGRSYQEFLLYNAGTGLATGMVFNGQLHRGVGNAAGENGHISIDQSGSTVCSCGLSGCIEKLLLEARAGIDTIPAYLPRIEPPAKKEYSYLALNIVQLVNLINPPAVILTGGMFTGDPTAAEWVRRAVYAHALPIAVEGLQEMALSRTAPYTGLVGAAALVFEAQTFFQSGEA